MHPDGPTMLRAAPHYSGWPRITQGGPTFLGAAPRRSGWPISLAGPFPWFSAGKRPAAPGICPGGPAFPPGGPFGRKSGLFRPKVAPKGPLLLALTPTLTLTLAPPTALNRYMLPRPTLAPPTALNRYMLPRPTLAPPTALNRYMLPRPTLAPPTALNRYMLPRPTLAPPTALYRYMLVRLAIISLLNSLFTIPPCRYSSSHPFNIIFSIILVVSKQRKKLISIFQLQY